MTTTVDDLALVADFLNTLDERTFTRLGEAHVAVDRLATREGWTRWLRSHDLLAPDRAPGAADLDAAVALRTALRGALSGGEVDGDALAGFPLRLVAGPGGLRLAAATSAPGLDVVLGAVAHGVADGRWRRLKLCASPDCRWAYLDTSRNGGGRWCSMEICGNRQKTRTYRQRRPAPTSPRDREPAPG